jgi:formamidopyrimidine-DNA glycosylase
MPELPEVEAIVRTLRDGGLEGVRLQEAYVVRPLVTRPQAPQDVEHLSSKTKVLQARRRAKNIVIDLANEHSIRIHLRMSGDLRIEPMVETSKPSVRVWWKLSGRRALLFSDARALGRVHIYPTNELNRLFEKLGPEPLDRDFTAPRFSTIAKASRLPAKLFLMDQNKVAGLGNIYAAEALFRAKVSPFVRINSLSGGRLNALHAAIRDTLQSAVHSVYKAYKSPGGFRNHRDDFERLVYGRAGEACTRCGRLIQRKQQGGRSTYFCAHCQR